MEERDIDDLMAGIRDYLDEESTEEIPFTHLEKIVDKFKDVTNVNGYTYSEEDVEQTCHEMIKRKLIVKVGLEDWLLRNSEED